LKSKLYTDEEKAILKRLQLEKKKPLKKKNSTQHKPSIITKTQELVPINDDELNRCKALLHIDSTTNNDIQTKKTKKDKSVKQAVSTKVKNITTQAVKNIKKKVTAATTALPVSEKKIKTTKRNSKTDPEEKKSIKTSGEKKTSANRPVTPPSTDIPIKTSSSSSPPPTQSSTNTKSKREKLKIFSIIEEAIEAFDTSDVDINDKNNSVVGRVFHFVKNIFQLSDNLHDDNSIPEDQIIDITNEQQPQANHHHHSRKLLTINDEDEDEIPTVISNDTNDYEFDLYLNDEQPITGIDDLSFVVTSISKRKLLSIKTNKRSTALKTSNTKAKKAKTKSALADTNKPKVGWAYRYRISRYLDAQKMKRTGNKNKRTGGGKTKHSQQHNYKQISSSSNTKFAKRKLLEYISDDDSSWERDEM
jgi:hypothetical protein